LLPLLRWRCCGNSWVSFLCFHYTEGRCAGEGETNLVVGATTTTTMVDVAVEVVSAAAAVVAGTGTGYVMVGTGFIVTVCMLVAQMVVVMVV
jgi:hypothetical protein